MIPRAWQEVLWFGRSQSDKQNKTNKLPPFIDRFDNGTGLVCPKVNTHPALPRTFMPPLDLTRSTNLG
jgi:hypothetical protein